VVGASRACCDSNRVRPLPLGRPKTTSVGSLSQLDCDLAFRGLSRVRVRASIRRLLHQTVGADPLLGFHLPGVFSPPATATPNAPPPLTHFPDPSAETVESLVPQSLSEQEDWLASLETADPSEVPVLVFPTPEGPLPFRGRRRTLQPCRWSVTSPRCVASCVQEPHRVVPWFRRSSRRLHPVATSLHGLVPGHGHVTIESGHCPVRIRLPRPSASQPRPKVRPFGFRVWHPCPNGWVEPPRPSARQPRPKVRLSGFQVRQPLPVGNLRFTRSPGYLAPKGPATRVAGSTSAPGGTFRRSCQTPFRPEPGRIADGFHGHHRFGTLPPSASRPRPKVRPFCFRFPHPAPGPTASPVDFPSGPRRADRKTGSASVPVKMGCLSLSFVAGSEDPATPSRGLASPLQVGLATFRLVC
jgi:hypothetical protein